MKLIEYNKTSLWGKVFKLKSEKFGTHIFLCSKYPAKFNKNIFIQLDSEWANTIFYTSVLHDEVLEVWNNIEEWRLSIN